MHIRNCTAADIEQAALIFREAHASQPYNESWETANASAYLKRFLDIEPAGCFVAEVDGHIAGAILSLPTHGIQAGPLVFKSFSFPKPSERGASLTPW